MIEEPSLLTIKKTMRRPTAEQVAAFQGVPTGFVVDAMFGGNALSGNIQPIGNAVDMPCVAAGPALTSDCQPGDILATLAALKFIQPGDIVVASYKGYQGCAAAGDRVTGMMKNCGASGFVTDGPVRDYSGIIEVGLPVWCSGLTPNSPVKNGPGKVGFPIQLGGQQVETGDMIIADRDGVVVVPFDKIDEVIEQLERIKVLEKELDTKVENGLKFPDYVTELLASDQVKFVD